MTRWRKRLGEAGPEAMLKSTIDTNKTQNSRLHSSVKGGFFNPSQRSLSSTG